MILQSRAGWQRSKPAPALRELVTLEINTDSGVDVYGTDTCKDTIATRRHLAALGVQCRYVNIEQDAMAAEQVERWNDGERKTPIVLLRPSAAARGGERVLSVPSNSELDAELDKARLLPPTGLGDGSPGIWRARKTPLPYLGYVESHQRNASVSTPRNSCSGSAPTSRWPFTTTQV